MLSNFSPQRVIKSQIFFQLIPFRIVAHPWRVAVTVKIVGQVAHEFFLLGAGLFYKGGNFRLLFAILFFRGVAVLCLVATF